MIRSARRTTLEALCKLESSTLSHICLVAGHTKECVRQALAFLKEIDLVDSSRGQGIGLKRANRWTVLPAGREMLKNASWTGYERAERKTRSAREISPRELYEAYHEKHVARQVAMGLSKEQIENEFDVRAYKGRYEKSEDDAA